MKDRFETASNDTIEVSVDLVDKTAPVVWRMADSDEDRWMPTPYQSTDVRDANDALKKVDLWLDTNYGQ